MAVDRASGPRGTSTTVIVRAAAPLPAAGGGVTARPAGAPGFSAARIFADRSPGVVTVLAYTGGQGAQGSGFVVRPDGTILTNAHVITNAGEGAVGAAVKPASEVYVEFADHDRIPARVVGWDVFDDVGVIRVSPGAHALSVLPLGRSAAVVVGEPVAAIGSPLGNEDSLTVGVVSAVGRSIAALTAPHFQLIDAIQIDAPIAHGSSGGPLLDASGSVIGINAQIRSDAGGPAGIGFAVPIDAARRSLNRLSAGGTVAYAYAGVQTEDLTPALARHLGVAVLHGALVDRVTPGGPAAKAGLRGGTREVSFQGMSVVAGGDVVTAVGGRPVRSADDLVRIVTNTLQVGKRSIFSVVRGRQRRTISVLLGTRPADPSLP